MATTVEQEKATGQTSGSRGTAFVLLALGNVFWAGTYTAGKIALRQLSPLELNALRFTIAALLLMPVLIRARHQIPLDRRSLFMLAQLSLLGFVLNKIFEYSGLALSTASDVALLIATESLFTALLSWTILHERVTCSGVAALIIGLAGAYLIVERGFAPNRGSGGSMRVLGDLLVILSLLIESAYTIKGKTALAQLSPLLITSATIVGSLFFWVPAGIAAVAHSGWPHLSLISSLAVLYMAVIATVIGYWLWFRALSLVDASAAAPTLFIQPLLGALIAVWLLHDTLTWATLLGGALIVVSLLLVVRASRQPPLTPLSEPVP